LGLLKGGPEELVESGALSTFFPHGLGHLLGLDVHDMEDLGDRAGYGPDAERSDHPALAALRLDRILEPGMVVTIEPGVYFSPLLMERARGTPSIRNRICWEKVEAFAGLGGVRIEDDVLVTEAGSEVLSAACPKGMAEIEELMASR
jgi:Xaa-Pro aminopeptidase